MKKGVFLYPVHEDDPNDGKDGNDWLERDKEAYEDEITDDVDVLKAYLELHLLAYFVEFVLIETKSAV